MMSLRRFSTALLALALAAGSCVAQSRNPASADPGAAAAPNPQQVATELRAGAREDGRIASAVAARLLRQPALSHVSVEVQGGIVTLGGKVSEDADRTQAQVLARQVHGVSDVVSAIRLDASVQTRFDRALDEGVKHAPDLHDLYVRADHRTVSTEREVIRTIRPRDMTR